MAERATGAQHANTAAATTCVVDVSGLSIQNGDIVVALFASGGVTPTLTFPSGFSAISGCPQKDLSGNGGNTRVAVASKIASGEPSTYTFTSSATDFLSAMVRVFSGRSATQFSATNSTQVAAASISLTYAISGVTAVQGDDICLLIGGSADNTTTFTYTPPAGFTNGLIGCSQSTSFSPILTGATLANASAGATGSLAGSINKTAGSLTYAYNGYVIAVAAAAVRPPSMTLLGA